MKLSVPEAFETPFAMLMKGVPEELQTDEQFKDAALVYMKLGGISIARLYVETRKKYFGYDPLEVITGFRFPRLQVAVAEEETAGEDRDDSDDTDDTEDTEDTEDKESDDKPEEEKVDHQSL